MNRLVQFIRKIYVPLIFIILEIAAINHYSHSTPYTRAKLLTASAGFTAAVNGRISGVRSYFALKQQNELLTERIAALENMIELYREADSGEDIFNYADTDYGRYEYTTAQVVNNSYTRPENFIIIDRGSRDGIKSNMALITPQGTIAGYVVETAERFAAAISILNTTFRTGGKIKDKEYFGSLWWDGQDHTSVTLSDIPKYADLTRGDTIVTGYSSIFPPDVLIGTVDSYELNSSSYFDVKVKLATPMSRLHHLLVVSYADIQERMLLEEDFFETD